MYRRVETDKVFLHKNGSEDYPIATIANEHTGRYQISIDDGCYIISRLNHSDGRYSIVTHIFTEVFDVLKTLPTPTKELGWELAANRE